MSLPRCALATLVSTVVSTLASLLCLAAAARADNAFPSFSSSSIVNAATGQPGFAPYSLCTLYGTDLYLDGNATAGGSSQIPATLAGVSVEFGAVFAGVLYVSANQINFLIPNSLTPGTYNVVVVRNGLTSPPASIVIQPVAPGLFAASPGFVAASHADGTAVTANSPAVPGEIIVFYGTGFGRTQPDQNGLIIAPTAAPIVDMPTFEVLLDGAALDPSLVQYAGVAPFNAGLYQVNVQLPADLSPDNPQLQVSIAGVQSQGGLALITGPACPSGCSGDVASLRRRRLRKPLANLLGHKTADGRGAGFQPAGSRLVSTIVR